MDERLGILIFKQDSLHWIACLASIHSPPEGLWNWLASSEDFFHTLLHFPVGITNRLFWLGT